jgi:hypothetical protein
LSNTLEKAGQSSNSEDLFTKKVALGYKLQQKDEKVLLFILQQD